jgi:hypothetical protein
MLMYIFNFIGGIMSIHEQESIKDSIYEAIEVSLEAQLRAIRRLRGSVKKVSISNKGMSQVDLAYDILIKIGTPLHINEIIRYIESMHQIQVDRESLVSSLTKKVIRGDRFSRVGKNTFAAKKT